MEVNCSKCGRKIESENINVSLDTAYCQNCENLTSLASILEAASDSKFDSTQKVNGVHISGNDYDWSIELSNRSWAALFLVPFTVVWVSIALSGIYGTQLMNGEFDFKQSLFGLPFLIGSIVLISITLLSVLGRTYVSNENGKGLIFIGVGSIGWYRRFEWQNIARVREVGLGQRRHISLEGKQRINLGWGLSTEKLYFMSSFLKTKLKT
ncbi:hypothetical protein [Vibrio genomosp. F6]|uniref:Uncharacterized protein n=1 Tax=Vibrio genomosp. F6 str. FF-238 TaxID=1191298 RepID=A0A1E5CV04_9VIBR|nr:hypothetical protein [Vibrio genomosp. F6]OEE73757.1 hypothetical protein A130_18485 [Vibrio genomosp. F6 str. FF-238]